MWGICASCRAALAAGPPCVGWDRQPVCFECWCLNLRASAVGARARLEAAREAGVNAGVVSLLSARATNAQTRAELAERIGPPAAQHRRSS
jgi:hypothetical protein